MILKIVITFFIVSNIITFASSNKPRNSTFQKSFEDDINSVKDDLYSLGNDTSDTSNDFTSLASDVESLQDDFKPLARCHKRHPFPFQDCYRDISVTTTKSEKHFTDEEFKDYKCELMAALAECISLKTKIYCGSSSTDLVKNLIKIFEPQYEKECNQTGIIKAHRVEFAI